ncbi:MAG: universal stress protein [Austwickia sp.]|nr:universal stress protein [Actinomycetota bacterium]MCB1252944.1 universal stress protein [Austwickia sp.]MCO5308003.1 universal stress protein [Austwickia sp.]
MTTTRWPSQPARRVPVGDVVAGLAGDGAAGSVARAAVREAVARGARVRFLQVLRGGLSADERAACDEATFTAALRALREAPRLAVTFEVVDGDPGPTFVRRSEGASVLVVAQDQRTETGVAGYCLSHANCDVLTVHPDSATPLAKA